MSDTGNVYKVTMTIKSWVYVYSCSKKKVMEIVKNRKNNGLDCEWTDIEGSETFAVSKKTT